MALVSVIMPTYNRRYCLGASIESILKQTYSDFELLLVDDGSNDDTEGFVRSIRDPRFRYLKTPHRGVSSARNAGIAAASGTYLAFCDSDDIWMLDTLAYFVEEATRSSNSDMLYGDAYWESIEAAVSSIEPRYITYVQGVPTGAMFFRKNDDVRFNPVITTGFEEWDLLLRLSHRGFVLKHCSKTVLHVSRSHQDHLMGDMRPSLVERLYLDTVFRFMQDMIHPKARFLIIVRCTPAAVQPTAFIMINHLRLFFPEPFDLAFDITQAEPAVAAQLTGYHYPVFSSQEDLNQYLLGSPYQFLFTIIDNLLVTSGFALPPLGNQVSYKLPIIDYAEGTQIKCFTTLYQPEPIIIESFSAQDTKPDYDPAVFLCDKATYLQRSGATFIPWGSPLLRLAGANKIV